MSVNPNYTCGAKAFLLQRFRERQKRIPLSELYRVSMLLGGRGVSVSSEPEPAPTARKEEVMR